MQKHISGGRMVGVNLQHHRVGGVASAWFHSFSDFWIRCCIEDKCNDENLNIYVRTNMAPPVKTRLTNPAFDLLRLCTKPLIIRPLTWYTHWIVGYFCRHRSCSTVRWIALKSRQRITWWKEKINLLKNLWLVTIYWITLPFSNWYVLSYSLCFVKFINIDCSVLYTSYGE